MRLPGLEWHPIGTAAGTTHARPVTKLLWHTTEGGSIAGALAVYKARRKVHPHFTYDPSTGKGMQHVDTDRASYSLHGVDRYGVIQVEQSGTPPNRIAGPTNGYTASPSTS